VIPRSGTHAGSSLPVRRRERKAYLEPIRPLEVFVRRALQLTVVIACIAAAFYFQIPQLVDEDQNKVLKKPPYPASERALNLHQQLAIVDLHADSLLWGRDLLERGLYGQVDIPRLADGNVALQVFSMPTKTRAE